MNYVVDFIVKVLLVFVFFVLCVSGGSITDYNVVWTSLLPEPGKNSEGLPTFLNAMPIGNGDFAALVFVDESIGSVSFLTSKSDAWNEGGEMNALGLVHLQFSPNPFSLGNYFHQELHLDSGIISIQFGGTSSGIFDLQIRIDAVTKDVLLADITINDDKPWQILATVENIRPTIVEHSYHFECLNYTTNADVIVQQTNQTFSYHRNAQTDYVGNTLKQLQLLACIDDTPDIFSLRTFGILLQLYPLPNDTCNTNSEQSPNCEKKLVPSNEKGQLSVTATSGTTFELAIWALSAQTESASVWINSISTLAANGGIPPIEPHLDWWTAYNNRSHLFISDFQVSQQYALTRYLHAIQSRGRFPIRYNGYIFLANRPPNTDYRDWGSQNWWQNVRLPYYSMLPSGDADQLQASLIGFFAYTLPFAQCQTEVYFGFQDSVYWSEYTGPFGATHTDSYGCGRPQSAPNEPVWYSEDMWNHYNQQQSLDLSTFILDHFDYTSDVDTLRQNLPLVLATLRYFYYRWSNQTDSSGHIVLYPTQSLETWQCPNFPWSENDCARNDLPTIAGLQFVLPRVLNLPSGLVDQNTLTLLQEFLPMIPALPSTVDSDGQRLIPCEMCPPSTTNVENTELYAVHPFRLYNVAKSSVSDLAVAQRTYEHMRFPDDYGWCQVGMDAALLGNVADTVKLLLARAAVGPAPGYRFPAFMPHFQDYEPSADHLANFANALYYALAQTLDDPDGTVVLFPTWPCEWDIDFKIHAPRLTVISGQLQAGTLKTLDVQPPERKQYVQVKPCQSLSLVETM